MYWALGFEWQRQAGGWGWWGGCQGGSHGGGAEAMLDWVSGWAAAGQWGGVSVPGRSSSVDEGWGREQQTVRWGEWVDRAPEGGEGKGPGIREHVSGHGKKELVGDTERPPRQGMWGEGIWWQCGRWGAQVQSREALRKPLQQFRPESLWSLVKCGWWVQRGGDRFEAHIWEVKRVELGWPGRWRCCQLRCLHNAKCDRNYNHNVYSAPLLNQEKITRQDTDCVWTLLPQKTDCSFKEGTTMNPCKIFVLTLSLLKDAGSTF